MKPDVEFYIDDLQQIELDSREMKRSTPRLWHAKFDSVKSSKFTIGGVWILYLSSPGTWAVKSNPFPSSFQDRIAAVDFVKRAWSEFVLKQVLFEQG